MSVPNSLARWIRRYGLAELVGGCAAIGVAWVSYALGAGEVVTAGFAAWSECLGYYAAIALRDLARRRREGLGRGGPDVRCLKVVLRELALEFGPAELLDSAFLRPLAIAFGIHAWGMGLGVIVGKLVADAVFYVPVIITHEWRRRALRTAPNHVRHSFGG